MPSPRYPLGSEWRKWDLQVHTPFSALRNEFGTDFDQYAKALFERAAEKRISAIGITDYFTIEGYKRLRAALDEPGRLEALVGPELATQARQILLLPNIELRTSVIITRENGKDSRVNFHVLFSNEVNPYVIEEHFLRDLKFTAEGGPGDLDERWPLTRDNLEALGRRLKLQHEEFQQHSDLYVGMMTAVIAHEDVTSVLETQRSRFKDRFLLAVAADEDLSECSWDGQGHLVRKLLIQKSHMLFSANSGTRAFGLGRKHPTEQDFLNEFKSLKPCIHGSDAHSYDSLFEPAERRYLWIKADPTFQGLRQLIHEPHDRVYLGESPPSLARERVNATKYMSAVRFERTQPAEQDENGFSGDVPLNHGLVAIIGNKGSGKSALADILALLGNTRNSEHFSFLTRDRFLAPRTMLGGMFRARVSWHSGSGAPRLLSEVVDITAPELVKYIPQNYLETICSELKESHVTRFDRELMEVIFSHVSDADRLGKETLPELIEYLTSEKEEWISQLAIELADVNAAIVAREEQLTPHHRQSLEAQLEQCQAELKAHDDAKPAQVTLPSQDTLEQEAAELVKRELGELVEQWERLDREIADAEQGMREAALQIAAADKLLTRIDNLERQVESFHAESVTDGSALGLDIRRLVILTADRQPISAVKTNAVQRSRALRDSLDAEVAGSLAQKRREVSARTEATRSNLDEPNRRYQEYLHQLADWQKRRDMIEGSASNPGSVKGLEAKLFALSDLPTEITSLKTKRSDSVREIFKAKQQLLEDYRRLHSPVQTFIDTHPVSQQQGALQFSASIVVDGLVDGLLEMMHQGRRGSFQGDQEGRTRLREISANSDFSTEAGVDAFLANIQEHLEHDKREITDRPVRVRDQLRQGRTPEDVYDFLYGLSYLKPRFELRWQGKPLDQLSPGERGNLLLVFYLLIDRRDVPLIIDQPEENLDNQTVATMLVPAIKHAKRRRQVIIVTHNPNLAVVSDADQVIHARLDKTDGNRVTYTSGAIEEPIITQLIVDVLEGTKPAFDLRDARYDVLERST